MADVQTLPQGLTQQAADLFRAISDPTRLKLLYVVAGRGEEHICSHELAEALRLAPPTVTHHMKRLVAVGLVHRHQHGKWAHYHVDPRRFAQLNALIRSLAVPCRFLEDAGHRVEELEHIQP
ncbi:ArsR family transcriptional regulator [Corynebacterium sp. 13CS0277]|nr:ArsR family transcriptional regulator [Corynebacterium sp. 13CS0277]